MTRAERRSFLKFLVPYLLLAGCGDGTGPETIAGRYSLQSVNGETLPFVLIQVLNDKVELTGGHLQINNDTTCSLSITVTATESGQVTSETEGDTCTWEQNGTAMFFTWSDGTTEAGSLVDGNLTLTSEGIVLLFVKSG